MGRIDNESLPEFSVLAEIDASHTKHIASLQQRHNELTGQLHDTEGLLAQSQDERVSALKTFVGAVSLAPDLYRASFEIELDGASVDTGTGDHKTDKALNKLRTLDLHARSLVTLQNYLSELPGTTPALMLSEQEIKLGKTPEERITAVYAQVLLLEKPSGLVINHTEAHDLSTGTTTQASTITLPFQRGYSIRSDIQGFDDVTWVQDASVHEHTEAIVIARRHHLKEFGSAHIPGAEELILGTGQSTILFGEVLITDYLGSMREAVQTKDYDEKAVNALATVLRSELGLG